MRNDAPRDAIASADVWVPVDATGADFYALGSRFGTQAGVLHALHPETGQPYAAAEGVGFVDPRCWRWHDLHETTPTGLADRRLAVQVVNDYQAPYEDARDGDAPFGQPEGFTSQNRSTREVDLEGRVALPSSHRKIVDSEDERYALALTCRSVPLTPAQLDAVGVVVSDTGTPVPDGVQFHDAGTESSSHGSVTRLRPSVSIGGVTFFGQAAVNAGRDAAAAGGSAGDVARWAAAAAFGRRRPKLEGRATEPGRTQVRPEPSEPGDARNPGGSVPLLDHPAGYVWSLANVIGLLGTLVCPEGAGGHYFVGREGTPIGPLPLRHDAQVTMGRDTVGRMVFVRDDAAELPEGRGKRFKGELWQDTSRANQDTELGHETTQWRPVVAVDADLPPSRLPPEDPPPWIDPRDEEPEKEGEEDEEDQDDNEGDDPPPAGGPLSPRRPRRPPGTPAPGRFVNRVGTGEFVPLPREPQPRRAGGDPPPVARPGSQARDYDGPGEPCPNATSGVSGPAKSAGTAWTPRSGGHPAITRVPGGLVVGGRELPLGLPTPPGGGIVVRPPTDDPGRVALGLPAPPDGRGGGFVFTPPLGGDRGVPRGAAERAEVEERQARARRAREAQDRREKDELDRLQELEDRAREAGRGRLADRARRSREQLERRRAQRAAQTRRREERRERERRAREVRRQKREARRAARRGDLEIERARRAREREERRRQPKPQPTEPQGGYMIEVTDEEARVRSTSHLSPEERRRLDADVRADEERRRARGEFGGFGDWNVANRPLPFFGAVGGPSSLEGWVHLATYAVRALQRTSLGAFGGPGYLAANLGVVHRNAPGNPPAGSRVGSRWSVLPGDVELQICDEPVVEVVSTLDARPGSRVRACGGAVLRVAREHRGEGQVDDDRPLVLLDQALARTEGDLVRDVHGRFRVDHCGRVSGPALKAGFTPDHCSGPALEVARLDPVTRRPVETHVVVERDGVFQARSGARVAHRLELEVGATLDFVVPGTARAGFRLEARDGAVSLSSIADGGEPRGPRLVLGEDGVQVEGTLRVSGTVVASAFKQA